MTKSEQYELENPVVSFRVKKNFKEIILKYMEKNDIPSFQRFVEMLLKKFEKDDLEMTYKVKD